MLTQLYAVQSKDLELDVFEAEKKKTPEELLKLRQDHTDLAQRLNAKKEAFDELRKAVNTNELEIDTLSARRKSAADAALQARSAKEVSQFQNQELQFATRLQELEEDTIPLLERQEAEQEVVDDLQAQFDEMTPRLTSMNEEEEARVTQIEKDMEGLKLERQALSAEVPAALLKQYEQIRRSRRGTGMAEIVGGKKCGGCNMQLPIHVIQKARKGGSGITRCPSCGRILWQKPADLD